MMPVSPIQVDVKPDKSCNNWRCCFGWMCCKKKEEDSPVSVEIIEKVTRTFERHHHSQSSSPVISKTIVTRLPSAPPLLMIDNIKEPNVLDESKE